MQSDQSKTTIRSIELQRARDLSLHPEHVEKAYDLAYKWLKTEPNDADALNVICYILLNTDKVAIAYPMLKHLVTIEPQNALAWLNLGMAASDLWRYSEAKRSYKRGLMYATSDKEQSMLNVNMASVMLDHGDFDDAEPYARKAIELNSDTVKGQANLGFCLLAKRQWAEGWKNYRFCLNSEWRPLTQYNDEPLWTGTEKGRICIYAEQGLGDEISFSQMLPDMKKWCDDNDSTLVVDINPRLEALAKRSFPDIEIHGTRGVKQIDWNPSDIDYSLPMGQIGEYFRCRDDQFTGEPYLKADPDRVLQWKALFESKKKPVIGIAWRGGIWKTAAMYRQLNLDALKPVMESIDAHWVSLQYRPATHEIEPFKAENPHIDLVEYPFATLSNDYDDTVAMIAAMDMVVTMQTTVVHVAGGLGVPCWAFIPQTSQWRYGGVGEDFPWANSVRLIRQPERGDWKDTMTNTGEELADFFRVPAAAAADARKQKNKLRNHSKQVRRGRRANGRCDGDRYAP